MRSLMPYDERIKKEDYVYRPKTEGEPKVSNQVYRPSEDEPKVSQLVFKKNEKAPGESLLAGNLAGKWPDLLSARLKENNINKEAESQPKWDENASFGVRDYLEDSLGVDGSRLNSNGEYVTFDGKPLVKAGRISDEGRSYVTDKEALDAAVGKYISDNGMVAVRDYVGSKGVPASIEWDDTTGNVLVNGSSVKPDFVANGRAYVYRSKLDDILDSEENGVKTFSSILNEKYGQYGKDIDDAYNAYKSIGEFSYDKNDDKAYQDFLNAYKRTVADEYNKNLAQARFRTGGVPSMGAMMGAEAIRKRALEDADSYAGQFEDRAYERYLNEKKNALTDYGTAWERFVNRYNLDSGANSLDIDNIYRQEDYVSRGILNDEARSNLGVTLKGNELYHKYAEPFAENELIKDNLNVEALKDSVSYSSQDQNWKNIFNLLDAGVSLYELEQLGLVPSGTASLVFEDSYKNLPIGGR